MTPSTDPNRPAYSLDVRVVRVGTGYSAHAAHLPTAYASAPTEREAVGQVLSIVSTTIRDCRKKKTTIPWQEPADLRPGETRRTASMNMPTRQEEMYRDKKLMALLQAWAKKPPHKNAVKQQRRVAAHLHDLGFTSEAGSVLRQSWRSWEDPAMICHYLANDVKANGTIQNFKVDTSTRMREEFETFASDHPVALMRLWWVRLNERTNAEREYERPSLLDPIDEANYEANQRKQLRAAMNIYHGKREDVENAVDTMLAQDQTEAEKHAEDMKEKVSEAYRRERDGALLREVAENLELKEVIERNEEKRREGT